eukprot:SAG31_NODE_3838_length_3832_cov_3.197696_3_plen_415_part_00
MAIPANYSDPWLQDWVKPEYNPVVKNTQRDPSSAWQTSKGEWRYTWYSGGIYSSWNFKDWTMVGHLFGKAECPDFFPIPRDCDGCTGGDNETRPTHVHATAGYSCGVYSEGAENTTGKWQPLGGSGHMDGIGSTFYYASKSFWDPVKSRRIVWGWVRVGLGNLGNVSSSDDAVEGSSERVSSASKPVCPGIQGAQVMMNSMPREITYDPLLQQLLFFPIEEMAALRSPTTPIAAEPTGTVVSGELPLKLAAGLGSQSETRVSFVMPTEPMRLGLKVMTGGVVPGSAIDLFVTFVPKSSNASGQAYWTVPHGFNAKNGNRVPGGGMSAPLKLKDSDTTIDIVAWVDHTVVEVFFMGGRGYWTVPLTCDALTNNTAAGISVYANVRGGGTATLANATSWSVGSIWAHDVDCGDNCS